MWCVSCGICFESEKYLLCVVLCVVLCVCDLCVVYRVICVFESENVFCVVVVLLCVRCCVECRLTCVVSLVGCCLGK